MFITNENDIVIDPDIEVYEKTLAKKYIKGNDIVLELDERCGPVSWIINKNLDTTYLNMCIPLLIFMCKNKI